MFVRDSVVAEPPPELLLPGAVDGAAGVLLIFPPFFFGAWKKNRIPVAGIQTRVPNVRNLRR